MECNFFKKNKINRLCGISVLIISLAAMIASLYVQLEKCKDIDDSRYPISCHGACIIGEISAFSLLFFSLVYLVKEARDDMLEARRRRSEVGADLVSNEEIEMEVIEDGEVLRGYDNS